MEPSSQLIQDISIQVETLKPGLVAFLQALVQCPSLPDHEHAVQGIIAEKLRSLGMTVDIVPTRYSDLEQHPAFSPDGFSPDGRINVVGRWAGRGGPQAGHGSLILNGHIDVVPVGNEALWEASPWGGVVRDGKLYGRGACDMKAGVAAGVFAIQALQALGFTPAQDVLVETVVGEESGGLGTLATIARGYRADGAIILEPTSLKLCPVQSGALTFRLTVYGRAAHAAMKIYGVSAIEKFALLLPAISELEVERHRRYHNPLYDDPSFVAPVSIGTIRGGDWQSSVPGEVVAEGRFGVFPGETPAEARADLEQAVRRAAQADPWMKDNPPRVEWFEGQFESGQTPVEHPLVQQVAAAHQALTGQPPRVEGVTWGSDLRLFTNHAGMPAVLYGPGDVSLAHTTNEWVDLEEVTAAAKVVALAIVRWCGGSRGSEGEESARY